MFLTTHVLLIDTVSNGFLEKPKTNELKLQIKLSKLIVISSIDYEKANIQVLQH